MARSQKLILASGSPRRLELLDQAGIAPDRLMPMDLDETPQRSEHPRSLARRLSREKADPFTINGQAASAYNGIAADGSTYYRGLAGDYVRLSEELAWEKKMIIPGGQVVTAFGSLRGDVFSLDTEGDVPAGLTNQDTPTRFMPTAGATWSVVTTRASTRAETMMRRIRQVTRTVAAITVTISRQPMPSPGSRSNTTRSAFSGCLRIDPHA